MLMYKILVILPFLLSAIFVAQFADASHNPHLFVSAEKQMYDNYFTGSMVIEVIVNDPSIRSLDNAIGEPDVSVNGHNLRMAQGGDGQWHGYFANKDKAREADNIANKGGAGQAGAGLDFGVFCSAGTDASVIGVSFSDTEGIAIPHGTGITGETNGKSSFAKCTGSPTTGTSENNVVRNFRSVNTNSQVPVGQIGIDEDAWPVIQLYSFSSGVTVRYNGAGGTQDVKLNYNKMENISIQLDRDSYPKDSQVFVTINDMQLNQDPTDADSWTFQIGSPGRTFYQAFDSSGSNAANGASGLIDISSKRSSLDFDDNGKLLLNVGSIAQLQTNQYQPSLTVSDGTTTFSNIVTFVETQSNSGIFENYDYGDKSIIKVLKDAPRGQSATIEYNSEKKSIVSGTFTASLGLDSSGSSFIPGKKTAIRLHDPDQNLNSGARDDLDLFNSAKVIPSIILGSPVTLEKATNLQFYPLSGSDLTADGVSITSTVNDTNSDILIVNTKTATNANFEKLSLKLGITASILNSILIDTDDSNTDGTNWINFDLRSFGNQLDVSSFTDTTMTLYFGSLSGTSVTILDAGDISRAQGLIQIDKADVDSISSQSGNVFLVINFDSSSDTTNAGTISSETDKQPIVFDIFSFGEQNSQQINNAIYRLELEETSDSSGIFEGTMELVQTNQFDPTFIQSLKTISDKVKLRVSERLLDERGVSVTYSDVSVSGDATNVSEQKEVPTSTGLVTLNSNSFRFGQPVIVRLIDPDLNQSSETIDIYLTNNDSTSDNVDAVDDNSGNILLDILIKDFRYKRCTINGVEHGGLASTGFTLTETGPSTGVFEGIFRMPTKICNKAGTELITTAGGSIKIKYHDARDSSGQPNIFGLSKAKQSTSVTSTMTPSKVPTWIKNNAKWWSDGNIDDTNFTNGIKYLINQKIIQTSKTTQMPSVAETHIPSWIKNNAGWWSKGLISEDDFLKGIEYLIEKGIMRV